MKILLIEDEADLANEIRKYLESHGLLCTVQNSVSSGIESLMLYQYQVIILDIGLPDGTGLDLIERILTLENHPGLIVISARGALEDRLEALDKGADDYLTKPFHLAELYSRIQAVFRRKNLNGIHKLEFNELTIFPAQLTVTIWNNEISLSPKEFQLLLFLAINSGKVLTKESIAEHLWGDHADTLGDFDFIYSHVKNIRRKIREAKGVDRIKAVYGIGYRFLSE